MADTIEKTIYRLELDGSDYIKGVDGVSASTTKLSSAQEAANKKLNQLKETTRLLKEEIKGYTNALKEQDKAVAAAAAKVNLLNSLSKQNKDAVAAANVELEKQLVIRNNLTSKISSLNVALNNNNGEITKQNKVLKDAAKSSGEFSGGLTKVYGGLSRVASIIPGLGLGGLIALLSGPLINAFKEWFDSANRFAKITKEITDNAIKSYTGEVTHLNLVKEKLDDLTIPQSKRIALAKDYNKTAEEGNKIDLKQIDNIDLINAAIDRQIEKIKQRALARAAENVITEKAEKLFLAQAEFESQFPEFNTKALNEVTNKAEAAIQDAQKRMGIAGKLNALELISFADLPDDELKRLAAKTNRFNVLLDERTRNILQNVGKQRKAIEDYRKGLRVGGGGAAISQSIIDDLQKELDETLKAAAPFITIEGLFTNTKVTQERKAIANIYEQELQKLRADIAKLDEKGFTDEGTITKAVEEDFKKRALAFDKAFKNKQLTASQVASLKGYLDSLQKLTLDQNLKSFREQKDAYLKQISTELENLQFEEAVKRISTIQDRFERERQMIITETDKTINAISDKRDKLISDITKNAAKNGLTPADIAPQIESIKTVYSKLLDDLEIIKNQKLQQLSFDTFERLSEDAKRILESGNLDISKASLSNIKAQTELFLAGKISYEKYQKELTAIARTEANARFRIEQQFLQSEIRLRRGRLATDKTLTDDQVKRLEDEIRALQTQLANAEKGNVTSDGTAKGKGDDNNRLKNLAVYADAIGAVADSVIQFWQAANEAEAKALDRSISLQEKRVEAAQRIAARGNAQYLKQEEDRLNELNVQRENAARKQLGIDAALQASQILVGITGAIAKIATPGIGIAETIAAMAIIIGSLATGYGLVKSLQGNQPKLFKGDPYVQRNGQPSGRDTIPAWLNEGEAVIPTDKNKAYHPTVRAVYDGSIPAEQLNTFVKNYHRIKAVPQPNYTRMKDAAELHIGQDGRMHMAISEQNKLIQENNDLQRQTLRAMKSMAVSANIDKNGVAIMVNEYIGQMKIDKRI